ncbi:SRPBCC family protein [Actinokineospora pegani]|uniref:SRPBCC family protein n=1 Tax=Actinokineospora pegani TaxID=2654637 RepID=UPI0012E9C913|nr:SRPBCC family protein [Actinokineospora pegani]
MRVITRSAEIPATAEAVWPVVSAADRLPDWYSLADRVDVVTGQGMGERRLAHGRHDGRRQEIDQEVVEHEPHKVIAWRQLAERHDGEPATVRATDVLFRVRLEPEGRGTRVRLESQLTPAGIGRAIALHLVGAAAIGRELDECLVRLTRSLELEQEHGR